MLEATKNLARRLGLEPFLMHSITSGQIRLEQASFLLNGRPDAASCILLAGSGRSGTTWIMNLLALVPGVQQVFEPLAPRMEEVQQLTGWSRTDYPHSRSFYLRASGTYTGWHSFLQRLLTGQVRSTWTDYGRRTSYAPRRYLIKVIRANLMLGYIYDNFRPKIVYITRHPCAAVWSRLKMGWYASVDDILNQEELVEDYLRPWVAAIELERDLVGAHAIWWAVENLVAGRELETRHHFHATYEAILLEPQQQLQEIFSWLGVDGTTVPQEQIERASSTSHKDAQYRSPENWLSGWQQELAASEQKRILDWANRLGVPWYYHERIN